MLGQNLNRTDRPERQYFRIILGKGNKYAEESLKRDFIGVNFGVEMDLRDFPLERSTFKDKLVPIYRNNCPADINTVASRNCGVLWMFSKGMKTGDVVLCPRGDRTYAVGEISDNYCYKPDEHLPHRRSVKWYPDTIARSEMSVSLQNATGAILTCCQLDKFANEIEQFINNKTSNILSGNDSIQDPYAFALEAHLESFLIANWPNTELGKKYDIYVEDDEIAGQQYQTDTGPIDILAISKDKKEYLVVELKKGRASDYVVGQIQRYMGYVKEEMAKNDEAVKGIIVALDDDRKIKLALSVAKNIEFYQYRVDFHLFKS